MTATAVILNWRDADSTLACVQSLFVLNQALNIVVVDNDSGDGSLERIRKYIAEQVLYNGYIVIDDVDEIESLSQSERWIATIPSGRNGGYAFGNNVGIRIALRAPQCRYIWILNADTLVQDVSALSNLLAYMDKRPEIGICGATVCYAADPGRVQTLSGGAIDSYGRTSQFGQGQPLEADIDVNSIERQLDYVNGACSFVRREFIEQIGLMSEDYFLYFEELDWYARARGRFGLGYCFNARVLHHVGKSIGTNDGGSRSELSAYYMNASRMRFCMRHLRAALPWVIMDIAIEIGSSIRRLQWRRSLAIMCGLFLIKPKIPSKFGII